MNLNRRACITTRATFILDKLIIFFNSFMVNLMFHFCCLLGNEY